MFVEDLDGNPYIMQATTTYDDEKNGNQTLSATIEYTKVNSRFIEDIARFWVVYDFNDVAYKIHLINRQGKGDKMFVTINAIPLFFDDMRVSSILDDSGVHYKHNGSMTARNAFNRIFGDTDYDYVLVDAVDAHTWTDFGAGDSRLETFKQALKNYGLEFEIVGSTIYLKRQIGRDTSHQVRYRLNANNIVQEIDASEQFTAIKGYGNYGESNNEESQEEDYRDARLGPLEYISPLADILGVRWAPPVMDGGIKHKATLEKEMKKRVDESLKISVSADLVVLTKVKFPINDSQVGDRIFLIDERIGLNEEIRIVKQSITRNWRGRVIDASLEFGNEGLGSRYQSNINAIAKNADAIDDLASVYNGKKTFPESFIDKRIRQVTETIIGNESSDFKYNKNGVIGWNADRNYMTRYVGDAIAFSDDGGRSWSTFMSAKYGINADYITAGELRGVNIYQESALGSLSLENGQIESFIDGKKAMKWGGWKQEFYNQDETLIGSLEPTRLLNSEHYGLSLTVTNDFLTIGHWIGGQRRPVFRTHEIDGRKATYVLGMYDDRGSENNTELMLGANSNIGLSQDGQYNRHRQPSLVLKNKPQEDKGNSAVLYFGGLSKFDDQEFEIRANTSEDDSSRVAYFRRDEIRFSPDKVFIGNGNAHLENVPEGLLVNASTNGSGLKLWAGGQVDVMSEGVAIHKFLSDGRKVGGSIDIDGKKVGMSPVDSPQVLIEYIEFDIHVIDTKKIYLDDRYKKSVGNYAVFSSNPNIKIDSKTDDYFIVKGYGLTDLRIVGKRKDSNDTFWFDMEDVA